ncbi:hypothetical protein AYI68_g5391 [Smittium mucronatum]|uniref:Uncharacterized protein n=1 Tax=Smittium mucronatum TaxID=133383 RepID=A0A1R0GUD8_9FUNG|nr:hypothetical protein AYI68_g5391 [Smittium mucronatum]
MFFQLFRNQLQESGSVCYLLNGSTDTRAYLQNNFLLDCANNGSVIASDAVAGYFTIILDKGIAIGSNVSYCDSPEYCSLEVRVLTGSSNQKKVNTKTILLGIAMISLSSIIQFL